MIKITIERAVLLKTSDKETNENNHTKDMKSLGQVCMIQPKYVSYMPKSHLNYKALCIHVLIANNLN